MGMGSDLTLKKTISLGRGRVTADANKTGVDVSKFEGRGVVVFDVEFVSGTSTYDAKLQHSEDDGAADAYADLKGPDGNTIAITQVTTTTSLQQKPIDWSACKKYVRVVDDVGAAGSPVYNPVILAEGYQQSGAA
jgi:hypothetical protein